MEPITGDRPPLTINQQFLDKYTNYLPAVFQVYNSLRYQEWLAQGRLPAPCRQVLAQCMEPITGDRPPLTINQQFLDKYTNYLPAVFQGARMMYLLDPTSQATAIKLATDLDPSLSGVSIPICTAVLNSLRKGEFGDCGDAASEYMIRCHQRFPLASAFNPSPPPSTPSPSPAHWGHSGVLDSQENCLSN
ncbi:N-alpha-acetyltransferase 15, NatA auxiliary subunit [Homalodisca vitripennis]|nr:N-alpha-acetyltransferase 15, NatA auxiliary subunit [Homalodisca vitripennis]